MAWNKQPSSSVRWLLCRMSVLLLASLSLRSFPAEPTDLGRISYSVPGGIYASNLVVALQSPVAGARIRFTLDGTVPSERSETYAEPLQITTSVVIKARAFLTGQASQPTAAVYTLLAENAAGFNSNLPLVIIDTFGQAITREAKAPGSIQILAPTNGRTALTGVPVLNAPARFNLRGHSSLRYPKRSYRVKLLNAQDQPEKASLFEFPKDSDWILYAPYPDKTLMRDVLAYELSNQMGRYAPRTQFVELFVNTAGGPLSHHHYMGVYVLEEKIKRAKERVAIEKLSPEDNSEPSVRGGYIFKKDHLERVDPGPPNLGGFPNMGGPPSMNRDGFPTGPGGFPGDPKGFLPTQGWAGQENYLGGRDRSLGGVGFVSPRGSQFLYVEPKEDEITAAQRRWLAQYIRRLESALYGPDFRDPAKGYAAYLDAASFIDHHLLVEVTKNIDGFRFSTFYHKDRDGKLNAGPIWDWNLSFGAANGKEGYMAEYWYWPQLDDQQYSWYRRLFEDPDFGQQYVDRWGELRTNQFRTAKLLGRIDELAGLLNEAQSRNFKRWRILGRQVWPQYYTGKSYADEVQYLKTWITQRLSWVDRQFLAGPTLTAQELSGGAGAKWSMRSTLGKVYYTLDGSDPRAPGGGVSARAQLYKSAVNTPVDAMMFARVRDGNRWSWPTKSRVQPKP
jgi:hypothetical protein